MRFLRAFFGFIFRQLYHAFAWSYDLVAAVVSLGHWNDWVRTAARFIEDGRVLELGPGPGHLQIALRAPGRTVYGLDESMPMLRQASRRLRRIGETPALVRGLAQSLPYPAHSFDTIAATFPAEYILDPATLREIARVLVPGGKLIILAGGWPSGSGLLARLASRLLRSEVGAQAESIWQREVAIPFQQTGFRVETRILHEHGGRLIYLIAESPSAPN